MDQNQIEKIKQLLDQGADIDVTNKHDLTALMIAASMGHIDCVHALIAARPKVDATSQYGLTALMYAAHEGHLEVVNMLLVACVDPNLTIT